ncbi:MAG: bifunctional folylpolyglutamate synthase/dihydrofolate synthase [Planctomycetota bacterium]
MISKDHVLPASINNYSDAVRWLYDRIDYERIRPPAQSNPFRLERIEKLLKLIGSPQESIPAVHIAGTKGKGSTAAMIDSVLQAAGIRSGLFTSPHIEQFEERMRVSGRMPDPVQLTRLVAALCDLLQQAEMDANDRIPTFFEVTTLLAWMYFQEERIELAVLETGLGGRLDCTNVCTPKVTVITSIGLDHTHILGDTLSRIAFEKAGILKRSIPVIQGQLPGDADAVVDARARELSCPRFVCGRDFAWHVDQPQGRSQTNRRSQQISILTPQRNYPVLNVPLVGDHQAHNASLAVMVCELLAGHGFPQLEPSAIVEGIERTKWPLRFEVIEGHPQIVLDAAHNPDSMKAVAGVLGKSEWLNRRRVLVFAASADKDSRSMLEIILPHFDDVVLTRFLGNPRSVPPEQLLETTCNLCDTIMKPVARHTAVTPAIALDTARKLAGANGVVVVTGSLFLAAESRGLLLRSAS